MAIMIGITAFCIIVCCFIGKEYKGAHFENAKIATQAGAGKMHSDDYAAGTAPRKVAEDEEKFDNYGKEEVVASDR